MFENFYLKTIVKADTEYLGLINRLTRSVCQTLGFSESEGKDIAVAVDEAITNTIKHAYMMDNTKDVEIEYYTENNEFVICITHTGIPFSPKKLVLPDMEEYLKKFKKGGLGVMLMIKIMDSVEYGSKDGRHFCKLTRKLRV